MRFRGRNQQAQRRAYFLKMKNGIVMKVKADQIRHIAYLPPKGLSAKRHITRADVDQHELAMGIRVEHEHTGDEKIAEQITLDHLAEVPDYYTKLKRVEHI